MLVFMDGRTYLCWRRARPGVPFEHAQRNILARFKDFLGDQEKIGENRHAPAWLADLSRSNGEQTCEITSNFSKGPSSGSPRSTRPINLVQRHSQL